MRRARRFAALLGLAPVLALSGLLCSAATPALAETECASAANPVACENAKPGDPMSDWQVNGVGSSSIQGYATSMSVNVGQTESFKINTPASSYHLDILRLGYYGGDGARMIASNIKPSASLPQKQPACLTNSSTGLIDCGNWGVSASWTVPSNAVSGVYIAHLVRNDNGEDSQIPFVVRNDSSHSEILLQTSDATWEAYNDWGGNSLYTCTVACPPGEPEAYKGAYSVSYNRPWEGSFEVDGGASYLWYAEYQMIFWLEEQGYNVSYTSESEVDNQGALLKNHKVFLSSGHDEYWSEGQRSNVESALSSGVNLAFFSGNEMFWKTRWGASTEGSNTPYRTLTSYKETHFNAPVDPQDPPTWTGSWRDPRFSPPANGGKPENALTGQDFLVNAGTADITVPSQYSKLRLWRGTAASTLKSGQSLTLAPGAGTLGFEWDEDVDNGFRPAGEFDLSSTTVGGLQTFNDYGSRLSEGTTATHHLTLYKAPSGALVFGAGTVQWAWGLADVNAWEEESTEPTHKPPDPNLEQATVNLLADMGAQPGSLSTGLAAAAKSTDTTPPTSTITSPEQGATLQDGSQITISGKASDAGGGVVAGVEVSTDGGSTWHPATLGTPAEESVSWSYSWAAHGNPTTTIKSRAVDDSANLEKPSAGVAINVTCPCSIWSGATPTTPDSGDSASLELGVKFTAGKVRHGERGALLQVRPQHGDPHRQPVDIERDAARLRDLHRRDGFGLAAGQLLNAGADLGQHDLRGRLSRAEGPLRRRPLLLLHAARARRQPAEQPAAACRSRQQQYLQRPVRILNVVDLPDRHLQRRQLLGRPRVHAGRKPRPGHRRERHTRRRRGERIVVRTLERGVPSAPIRSLPTSARPPRKQPR